MYNAGTLDRRILIQKKSTTRDALGGESVTWVSHYFCSSHIDFKKAYQDDDTERINSKEETIFIIRNEGIKAKQVDAYNYRIVYPSQNGFSVYNSQAYYITGVQEIEGRNAFLRITTEMRNDLLTTEFSNLYSIYFDSDGYLDLGNNFTYGNGLDDTPFSISLWFKTDDITTAGFLAKDETNKREYHLICTSTNKIRFRLYDNSTQGYFDVITVDDMSIYEGNWHHICATYSGEGPDAESLKLYIDGGLIDNVDFQVVGTYVAMENTTTPATFGLWLKNDMYFDGYQDEQSIWSDELTSSHVLEIYNSGTPNDLSLHSAAAKLDGWWRDGDGDVYPTILDASGNGKNGEMKQLSESSITTIVP